MTHLGAPALLHLGVGSAHLGPPVGDLVATSPAPTPAPIAPIAAAAATVAPARVELGELAVPVEIWQRLLVLEHRVQVLEAQAVPWWRRAWAAAVGVWRTWMRDRTEEQ